MKTILVIDDGVVGHKYAFNKLFVKYLLQLDYKVVLALPKKALQIKEELSLERSALSDQLVTYEYQLQNSSIKFFPSKRVRNVLNASRKWMRLSSFTKKIEDENELIIDYVFISMLDGYLMNYLSPTLVDICFNKKWAGLYFHPWYLFDNNNSRISLSSVDSALRSRNCIAIGVHDEQLIKPLKSRINKKVLYFPEIADGSRPQKNNSIAKEITKRSKGRPVVGLVGLARRKNVLLLMDVMSKWDVDNDFFYFISGTKPSGDYNESEEIRIDDLFVSPPENVLTYPGNIQEGPEMNAVIESFDMLFLVYRNFKSSSNLLTKAVLFKKPTLGCESYWIGENIRAYNLGFNLKGDDAEEVFSKMKEVKNSIKEADWKGFLEKNDETNLYNVFDEIFGNNNIELA